MRQNKKAQTVLSVATALAIVWLVRRKYQGTGYMPGWEKVIQERYGPEKAPYLISDVHRELSLLLAETPMPKNRTLKWHLAQNILPGLALYRVLLKEHGDDQQAAIASFESVVRAWTISRSRIKLLPLKILPAPFFWFRLVFPTIMKQYPPEGWDTTMVNNDKEKVGFDMTRCYYLDTLTSFNAPELTASFCKGDDVMAELFPTSIHFERPHTLGRGDQKCDFRYCLVKQR